MRLLPTYVPGTDTERANLSRRCFRLLNLASSRAASLDRSRLRLLPRLRPGARDLWGMQDGMLAWDDAVHKPLGMERGRVYFHTGPGDRPTGVQNSVRLQTPVWLRAGRDHLDVSSALRAKCVLLLPLSPEFPRLQLPPQPLLLGSRRMQCCQRFKGKLKRVLLRLSSMAIRKVHENHDASSRFPIRPPVPTLWPLGCSWHPRLRGRLRELDPSGYPALADLDLFRPCSRTHFLS